MRHLTDELHWGKHNFVYEADIKGFFDHVQHEPLLEMLSRKIQDGAWLRLIRKWFKAGILEEDGQVLHPELGPPQGGMVSPVLANVYLHYVLDLWLEEQGRKTNQGHWNDYGIMGNSPSLNPYHDPVSQRLDKWLNRRSQKRSDTWRTLNRLLKRFHLPPPRIVEQVRQKVEETGQTVGKSGQKRAVDLFGPHYQKARALGELI